MNKGQRILVEWQDIFTLSEWLSFDDTLKKSKEEDSIRYYTYGFFVEKTKDRLRIASTASFKGKEVDMFNDISSIPLGCIVSVKKVL